MSLWLFMFSCVKDSDQDGRLTRLSRHNLQETVNIPIFFAVFNGKCIGLLQEPKKLNQNNIVRLKTNLGICDVPVWTRRRKACQKVKMIFFVSTHKILWIEVSPHYLHPHPWGVFGTFPKMSQTVVKLITICMISNNDSASLTYFSICSSIMTQTWFISISGERLLY